MFVIYTSIIIFLPISSCFYFAPRHFSDNPRIPPTFYTSRLDTFLSLPNISYYPPPPRDHSEFTSYGSAGFYHNKALIKDSELVAGLAWKDLLRNQHHHDFYNIEVEDTTERTIHDVYRERYTAKIIPSQEMLDGFESYNVLEMTNYISMEDRGLIYSLEGNASCISIYNTKALINWHQKHEESFKKQFPNSTFPLYISGNHTSDEKFKITPGRIVHREPVSITCCGTLKEKINLKYHINGQHPCINCYTRMAYIPLRKLLFSRIEEETPPTTESGEWYEIELYTIKQDIDMTTQMEISTEENDTTTIEPELDGNTTMAIETEYTTSTENTSEENITMEYRVDQVT